jgi:glycosyltransferase involved in cell wall biosynthesis
MRVLQCVNYFHPSVGGLQLATYHLAENLVQLGIDVKIVAFNIKSLSNIKNGYFSADLPSYEKIGSLPVYRFPIITLGKMSGHEPHHKIIVSPSAVKMVLREKPDIIHFQGASEVLQAILTSYAMTFSRSKTVLTDHGLYTQVELFRKWRFSKSINEMLLRFVLRKVNHIIALSKYDLEIMNHLKISPYKVSVIPNGINFSRYSTPLRGAHYSRNKRDLDAPYILCVTRIREAKGLEFLIRAAAQVVSKRPEAKFFLVGNCPKTYAEKLRNLTRKMNVEKNFLFKGHIPHESDELLELYRRASIFVLPSLMESFPLVLLEAMASSLPIVASQVGGIPDLVSPSEGILVAPGNIAQLSSSILFLLENGAIRNKLGESAREKARNYSWGKVAQETISVYEKLLVN